MTRLNYLKSVLIGGASVVALVQPASAKQFDIPRGDLATVLDAYIRQAGVQIVYSDDVVRGHHSQGAHGNFTELAALTQILSGTGFTAQPMAASTIGIVRAPRPKHSETIEMAAATPRAPAQGAVETVVVTAQKKSENIQNVPIAVTALSQAQLTERQIAGGPDLVKEVPNLTFSKTNFTGYNIEIRGIGTQAISVTTDPAVAVALNGIPFIRNHFFEQEFYDLSDVEVLRGPQGTLYGRNATAGVVNVKSALPVDNYEAMLSADMGNFSNRRLEAMLNVPIVGDKLDIRIAGEWTKRDGYSFNELTNQPIDGRDLWSTRFTIGWKPTSNVQAYLVWEHFSEDDDRLRSSKQLCKTDLRSGTGNTGALGGPGYASQGCLPVSLYSPEAFEVPNGSSLPYVLALVNVGPRMSGVNPYTSTTQSTDLRVIESSLNPAYKAKNDTFELNVDYDVTQALTLASQTGYNQDFLYSSEDYNRFDTTPDVFVNQGPNDSVVVADGNYRCNDGTISIGGNQCVTGGAPSGVFCDPQLGCSNRLVGEDLSKEHAWQLSQEFRLASHFSGPLNFSAGGNYLHYETAEDYYVFINALSLYALGGWYSWNAFGNGSVITPPYVRGVSNNSICAPQGFTYPDLSQPQSVSGCDYVDPNPIAQVDGRGHNYFRSYNPYVLNSYASFGEADYDLTDELKLTAGLRWTEDRKHFTNYPSEVLTPGWGYPSTGVVDQQWDKLTGRFVTNWTPKLDFTDQTLVYGSFAHGYKAGGANPPGAILLTYGGNSGPPIEVTEPIHPLTFKPEFIDAYELGTKNTLLNGALTLNGDIFYYDYKNYQISEIVDRTSINLNFNATVKGAELETTWEPAEGLKFSFAGGYEDTRLANGSQSVDLMDRTAGHPGWFVSKPFITQASNCILPVGVPAGSCGTYVRDPNAFNAPNNGAGFDKDLSGNQLPNAPHFTTSLTGEYSFPVSDDWAATLHGDFYWQSQSYARVFNDRPYDKLRGYSNVNLALILTSANGWQVMGYVKNIFDTTAITGDFLNSDDTGLTTNVFLTDPRLYGVRVTKQLDENDGFWGSDYSGADLFADLFADKDNGKPQLWIELGAGLERLAIGQQSYAPPFESVLTGPGFKHAFDIQSVPTYDLDEEAKVSWQPSGSDWEFTAAVRYGRSAENHHGHYQTSNPPLAPILISIPILGIYLTNHSPNINAEPLSRKFAETIAQTNERHAILDFQAGRDVGLGPLGGNTTVDAGLRIAQFTSRSTAQITANAGPQFETFKYETSFLGFPARINLPAETWNIYHAKATISRSFHGAGPSVALKTSVPLARELQDGQIGIDLGINGAVLFGRQRTQAHHQTSADMPTIPHRYNYKPLVSIYRHHFDPSRSRGVTVPNLGGFAAISFNYANAKVSFGYRADVFFSAVDGGIDSTKSYDRAFFGPYADVSIGLGG